MAKKSSKPGKKVRSTEESIQMFELPFSNLDLTTGCTVQSKGQSRLVTKVRVFK